MKDELLDLVTDEVLRRLNQSRPRALLIGEMPSGPVPYTLVNEAPYEAVILGSVSVSVLLSFDFEPVLAALLEGTPVYAWDAGLPSHRYQGTKNRALLSKILAQERMLRQLGVKPLSTGAARCLITAQQLNNLLDRGAKLPQNAVLTPLARDILEGKTT